jgi:glutathione S-transferase
MAIELYDLAGAEPDRRFSPYCWRIKLSLRHKGLAFETIPWRLTEKSLIAPYNSERVPVLVDNGHGVADSWKIANYLDDSYPDGPALFGGKHAKSLARFYNQWTDATLHGAIGLVVVPDITRHLDPRDRDYFRTSREALLGPRSNRWPLAGTAISQRSSRCSTL